MINLDTTDVIKMVNENSDLVRIAEYIGEYVKDVFEFTEAKEVATYLVKNLGYTKEEILNGKANKYIVAMARYKMVSAKSVEKEPNSKEKAKVPLKTKKKKISKKVIATALASLIGVSFVIGGIKYGVDSISEYKEDTEIANMIGMLAQDEGEAGNIISQNTYGFYSGSKRTTAYKVDKIAEDIIDICIQNPDLLDITLYRTYFDMNYNRLDNMDDVIRWLKIYASNDESLNFINDKLKDTTVFLEYVLNCTISSDDKDYKEYQDAIVIYKALKENNDYVYDNLPKDTKKSITKLINKFENKRDSLYTEYKDDLETLLGSDDGGRK